MEAVISKVSNSKNKVNQEKTLYTETNSGESMTDFNLGDIPDLSGIEDQRPQPLEDGWYQGTFLAKREFTDNNGNERVFESSDTPAQRNGRNIRLQVELTRKSDGRKFYVSNLINYLEHDLTPKTSAEISKRKEENKESDEEDEEEEEEEVTLTRLGKLQKIAGVRQLQRNGDGGLDLTPVYGKTAYFKIRPDSRNAQYKEIADFQENEPKRVPVH